MTTLPNRQIWGVQDNADRQAGLISAMEIAEIIKIHPHIDIYPADKFYMTVDLKIRDLKLPPRTPEEECKYVKINVVQRCIGNLWGKAWIPRKGDVVLIQRVKNSDAIYVLGQIFNKGQEPVVTQYDDDFNISSVDKWIQHEQPTENNTSFKNFPEEEYLPPSARDHPTNQPVCKKIFSRNRDTMCVYGCDHGYIGNDPHCKQCIRTGYVQTPEVMVIRTNSKETTNQDGSARDSASPYFEKVRRFQMMHHNGSQQVWDEDGNLRWQNDVSKVEKGHIKMDPYGTTEIRSTPEAASDGSYARVYGPSDPATDAHGTLSIQAYDVGTGARVTIYKNGDVTIYTTGAIGITSTSNITLTAPEIDIKGRLYTSES